MGAWPGRSSTPGFSIRPEHSFVTTCSHHFGDGSVVVTLHFPIGDLAVAFRGFDAGMPQKILDGDEIRIGIEELRGHGVPELVA